MHMESMEMGGFRATHFVKMELGIGEEVSDDGKKRDDYWNRQTLCTWI